MKNKKAGFFTPLLIAIISLIVVGGGVYFYVTKNSDTQVINQVENSVATTTTQDILDTKNNNTSVNSKKVDEESLCVWSNDNYKIDVIGLDRGHFGGYNKVKINIKNNQNNLVTSKTFPGNICPKFSNGNKVYLEKGLYEQEGQIFLLDLDNNNYDIVNLEIGSFGKITPDNKYYVYTGDTSKKDAVPVCASSILNSIQTPKSAIFILDLSTSKSILKIENKDKYFKITNVFNDIINYTQGDIHKSAVPGDCPEIKNEINSSIEINRL
jgi:hypothetical protein